MLLILHGPSKVVKTRYTAQHQNIKVMEVLLEIWGLSFLSPSKASDCFVEDEISNTPDDKWHTHFADYIVVNYAPEEANIATLLWAATLLGQRPSLKKDSILGDNSTGSMHNHLTLVSYSLPGCLLSENVWCGEITCAHRGE